MSSQAKRPSVPLIVHSKNQSPQISIEKTTEISEIPVSEIVPKLTGIQNISMTLPDGLVFKSMIQFNDIVKVQDLLKVISDKTGVLITDDLELVAQKGDKERIVLYEEYAAQIILQIREKDEQLVLRKKKQPTIQRRLTFVPISNRAKNSSSAMNITTPSNTLEVPGSNTSNFPLSPQPLKGRRISSLQEGLNFFTGKGKDKEEPPLAKYAKDTHITELEGIDKKLFQDQLVEVLQHLFEGTEHGLNFSKLTERNRFWSRGSLRGNIDAHSQIFGVAYDKVMEHEFLKDQESKIPKFFRQCLDFLEDKGMHTSGIFRISGVARKIKSLKDEVDKTGEIQFTDDLKVHDISGLLKMFFREMPEPLLTFKLFDFYMAAIKFLPEDKRALAIQYLSYYLPTSNVHLLEAFLKFLKDVADCSNDVSLPSPEIGSDSPGSSFTRELSLDDSISTPVAENTPTLSLKGNLMSANNLAICIGPNILSEKNEKAENMMNNNDLSTKVVELMIENANSLFIVPKELFLSLQQKK